MVLIVIAEKTHKPLHRVQYISAMSTIMISRIEKERKRNEGVFYRQINTEKSRTICNDLKRDQAVVLVSY